MTDEQRNAIQNLAALDTYFAGHATESIIWQREYEVNQQILKIITDKINLTKEDFIEIVSLFNKIEDDKHFDGSGWVDYKMRLSWLFGKFGYKIQWNSAHKIILSFDNAN